jgi:hypothetical protein
VVRESPPHRPPFSLTLLCWAGEGGKKGKNRYSSSLYLPVTYYVSLGCCLDASNSRSISINNYLSFLLLCCLSRTSRRTYRSPPRPSKSADKLHDATLVTLVLDQDTPRLLRPTEYPSSPSLPNIGVRSLNELRAHRAVRDRRKSFIR